MKDSATKSATSQFCKPLGVIYKNLGQYSRMEQIAYIRVNVKQTKDETI